MRKTTVSIALFATCLLINACSIVDNMNPSFLPGSRITLENAHQVVSFDTTNLTSVVDYYFASRIRGDDKWKEVLPQDSSWSERLKRKLSIHDQWGFTGYQLREIRDFGSNKASVLVMMELEYKGKTESGVDDVTVQRINDGWVIIEVPT